MGQTKKCQKCNETKTVSEFHRDKTRKDGIACYCKKCKGNYRLKHSIANRIKIIEMEISGGFSEKKCLDCGNVKQPDEFYRNRGSKDGLASYCKQCSNIRSRECWSKNKESIAKKVAEWKKKNPEKAREHTRKTRERAKILYPERIEARRVANMALKRGKIKKENCSMCGYDSNIEMHHEDYSKPLDVIFLCRKCHNDIHAGERMRAEFDRLRRHRY